MKNHFLIYLVLSTTTSFGQTMKEVRDSDPNKEYGDTKLYLVTDIKTASASSNNELNSTGTGKLGVSFKSKYFYGSILFNVVNRNKDLSAKDTTEKKIFANNLLIPDNSGQGLSNFYISLGVKSFIKFDENHDWGTVPLVSYKRIGAYGFWQVNNTVWTKDKITTPLYISSLGFFLTYNILSLQILGEDKEKVYISWFGGFENRILGGDYSLEANKKLRTDFLNTEQTSFKSFPVVGFKLELGKFFGKITETHFGDGDIAGFSGWQAIISVGVNVDLNIAAKKSDPTK